MIYAAWNVVRPSVSLLYLEDDPGLARLTQKVLAREGIRVDTTDTGQDALERLGQSNYDVVLVDYRLPGMSGLEVIAEIVRQDSPPPVIMITGEGNEALAVEAMKAGASDYLTKDSESQFLKLAPMRIHQAIDRANMAREKLAAEEARKVLIQELDAFAHTVAHDLKNPLNNILLNLDRLEYAETPDSSALIGQLREELQRSKRIVDGLLLLATVRRADLHVQPVSLRTGFDGAISRLAPQIREAGARIKTPGSWPRVLGRSDWLEEVWANYLSNALVHGGPDPKISITWEQSPGGIKVWVADNGPGVPPENREALFQPLASSGQGGHGLGLSIVARIMQRLGGSAGLEPETPGGASFYFEVPVAEPGKD